MTDKDRIAFLIDLFGKLDHEGEKSIKAHGRRFVFDDQGALVKIQEFHSGNWREISNGKNDVLQG